MPIFLPYLSPEVRPDHPTHFKRPRGDSLMYLALSEVSGPNRLYFVRLLKANEFKLSLIQPLLIRQ